MTTEWKCLTCEFKYRRLVVMKSQWEVFRHCGQLKDNVSNCEWLTEVDVPAIQELRDTGPSFYGFDGHVLGAMCSGDDRIIPDRPERCYGLRWTCQPKSRILLTAEDGTKHCIKFTR